MSSVDQEIEETLKKLELLKNQKNQKDSQLYDEKYQEYLKNEKKIGKKIEKLLFQLKNEKNELDKLGLVFPEKVKENNDKVMVKLLIKTFPKLIEDPDKSSLIIMYNQKNHNFKYEIPEIVFKIDKDLDDFCTYEDIEDCQYFQASNDYEYKIKSINECDYGDDLFNWIASCQKRRDMPKSWPKNVGILDHYHYFPQVDEGDGWDENEESHDFSLKFWK